MKILEGQDISTKLDGFEPHHRHQNEKPRKKFWKEPPPGCFLALLQ